MTVAARPKIRGTLEERFWHYTEQTEEGCWPWHGYRDSKGYGKIGAGGGDTRILAAHRVSYELNKGPIPEGLVLDHLCRTPWCVNPDHLEAVTLAENTRRGVGPTVVHARKTHCVRGHEFTPDNIIPTPEGWRCCKTCKRERDRNRNKERLAMRIDGRLYRALQQDAADNDRTLHESVRFLLRNALGLGAEAGE